MEIECCTSGFRGEIECSENNIRGESDVREAKVKAMRERDRLVIWVFEEFIRERFRNVL